MLLQDIILEAPATADPLEDFLGDLDTNQGELRKLLMLKPKHVMSVNDNFVMYSAKMGDRQIFFGVVIDEMRIVYYMVFETEKSKLIGKFVYQSYVWVDKTYSAARGLPRLMFFNHLLLKYKTVVTDSIQTWDGRKFWMSRIKDALEKNIKVYYVNFETNHIEEIHKYEDVARLNALHKIWANYAFDKRMVISLNPLIK